VGPRLTQQEQRGDYAAQLGYSAAQIDTVLHGVLHAEAAVDRLTAS